MNSVKHKNKKKLELGKEMDLVLKIEGDQLVLRVEHAGTLGSASFHVGVDAAKLVDALTDLIPGEWDDALLDDLAKRVLSKKSGE